MSRRRPQTATEVMRQNRFRGTRVDLIGWDEAVETPSREELARMAPPIRPSINIQAEVARAFNAEIDRGIVQALTGGAEEDMKAAAKARQLLLENLNTGQREQFLRHEYFDVHSRGEDYRFKKDITLRIRDGERYCLIFPGLPIYDQLLARKLFLENWPDEFFKVANIFPPTSYSDALGANGIVAEAWSRAIFAEYTRQSAFVRHRFREPNLFGLLQDLIAQRARRLGIDPQLFEVEMREVDFRHAIEVEISYDRRARRCFAFETDHLRSGNLERFLRGFVDEVVTYICEEVRDADQRRTIPGENHEAREESSPRVQRQQSRRSQELENRIDAHPRRIRRRSPFEWDW